VAARDIVLEALAVTAAHIGIRIAAVPRVSALRLALALAVARRGPARAKGAETLLETGDRRAPLSEKP
jgi:hypothetical protein